MARRMRSDGALAGRGLPVLSALLLASFLAGCMGEPATDGRMVTVRDNEFEPSTVTIAAGDTVHFENVGARTHTVTIRNNAQDETVVDREVPPGQTVSITLVSPGDHDLICRFHAAGFEDPQGMTGTLLVTQTGEG